VIVTKSVVVMFSEVLVLVVQVVTGVKTYIVSTPTFTSMHSRWLGHTTLVVASNRLRVKGAQPRPAPRYTHPGANRPAHRGTVQSTSSHPNIDGFINQIKGRDGWGKVFLFMRKLPKIETTFIPSIKGMRLHCLLWA
jgi:hypothetical protein